MRGSRSDARRRLRSALVDWVPAVAVAAVMTAASYAEAHPNRAAFQSQNGHPVPHTPTVALLLVVAAGLALVVRRRHPLVALATATAAVLAYTAPGYVNGAALVVPAVAVYSVGIRLPARTALLAGGLTLVALMAATGAANPFGVTGGGFDILPATIAVPCLAGIAVANRRASRAAFQDRLEQEGRARVDEERLRIARELHDVVAHTMATINVQAGVAAHLLADRPDDPARAALVTIRDASKQGLAELRAILDVLRRADEGEPTQPAPGVDRLAALAEQATAAGLATTVRVVGVRRELPSAVDVAAYRIVQEALTNAVRHAGAATATVTVGFAPAALSVDVLDDGAGTGEPAPASGGGHGLVGMRERVATLDGQLRVGPEPAGGWRVSATLPLAPDAPAADASRPQPARA